MKQNFKNIAGWTAQITVAAIFFQTLYFKFSGSEESVYIFTTLGVEPWGRFAAGAVELIASIMLLIPRTAWMGAFISIAVISTAIVSHLTILGLEVMDDGGLLFSLAGIVFFASLVILVLRKKPLKDLLREM